MIVTQLLTKIVEAKIITGTRIAQKVFLPRITLTSKDEKLPFYLNENSFRLRFVMQ